MTEQYKADVLLILEGTYPYIRGGVSSWVHQMIQGLPDTRFELVFIGGAASQYGPQQYELPKNVTGLHVHYLMDSEPLNLSFLSLPSKRRLAAFEQWQKLLEYFRNSSSAIPDDLMSFMFEFFGEESGLPLSDFLYSKESWDVLANHYLQYFHNTSFVDFFWTYRNIYKPLFIIADLARRLPKTRLIHSISTGYAGILGAGTSLVHKVPYIITEHGIYTKERKIDLVQAEWINESKSEIDLELHAEMGDIRKMWIQFFEQIGHSSYHQAQQIISLYEGNRKRQITDGAEPEKTLVIPNGIKLSRFSEAYSNRPKKVPMRVGLIGRVVPIKDIKTFIRAIKETQAVLPELEGWIIGPTEEDPDYVTECEMLVSSLELDEQVKFLGMQNVTEILPQLGLVALTSISEAQPLVLLESMAAGVPVLATDVGSCREIIHGFTDEDKAIGSAGKVVSIASPSETARAITAILSDSEIWEQYQQNGLQRVNRFYDEALMFKSYQSVYEDNMLWPE